VKTISTVLNHLEKLPVVLQGKYLFFQDLTEAREGVQTVLSKVLPFLALEVKGV